MMYTVKRATIVLGALCLTAFLLAYVVSTSPARAQEKVKPSKDRESRSASPQGIPLTEVFRPAEDVPAALRLILDRGDAAIISRHRNIQETKEYRTEARLSRAEFLLFGPGSSGPELVVDDEGRTLVKLGVNARIACKILPDRAHAIIVPNAAYVAFRSIRPDHEYKLVQVLPGERLYFRSFNDATQQPTEPLVFLAPTKAVQFGTSIFEQIDWTWWKTWCAFYSGPHPAFDFRSVIQAPTKEEAMRCARTKLRWLNGVAGCAKCVKIKIKEQSHCWD